MRWCEIHEAAPTDEMRAMTYYHGCPDEGKAQSILQSGITPQDIAIKGMKVRGHMTPVANRVYVTNDLRYAIIYSLGGDYLGHKPPKSDIGQWGHLFAIPGSELLDVQPDEDSVGEFFYRNSTSPNPYSSSPVIAFKGEEEKREVWRFIHDNMTPTQRGKAIRGEYAAFAAGGKRVLKSMPDWMKIQLIHWGAHVAHAGGVMPNMAWRIDKGRSGELKPDGSNFFSIAERIL